MNSHTLLYQFILFTSCLHFLSIKGMFRIFVCTFFSVKVRIINRIVSARITPALELEAGQPQRHMRNCNGELKMAS